jgi:hypothetical protein
LKQLPQITLVPGLNACGTWLDVRGFLELSRSASIVTSICAAQYAMLLAARSAVGTSKNFDDALQVLNSMARAKAGIDIVLSHSPYAIVETKFILRAAQDFLEKGTIPCNEWPHPQEIADEVERVIRQRVPGGPPLKYFRKICEPSGFPPQAIESLDMCIEYSSGNDILNIFDTLGVKPEIDDGSGAWVANPGHCEIFGIKVFISCDEGAIRISASPGSYDVTDVHYKNAEIIEAKLAGMSRQSFDNLKIKVPS